MAAFDLSISVDEVIDAADRLARIESTLVGTTAVKSINKVLPRTYAEASRKMLSGINLTKADLEDAMTVTPASDILKPEGVISAKKRGLRPITFRRFVIDQILAPVKWKRGFVMSMVAKRMKNPIPPGTTPLKWTVRQGDRRRGIPREKKFNGIEIQVTRGRTRFLTPNSTTQARWFLLPTRNGLLPARVKRGAVSTWGRKGKSNIEVVKGPSVWQLFKFQIPGLRETALEDLRKTLSADVRDDIMSLFK